MASISQLRAMRQRRVEDWAALAGVDVEIRLRNRLVCSGPVDAATADGEILWIRPAGAERRLYEKAQGYEAWADEVNLPIAYRLARRAR